MASAEGFAAALLGILSGAGKGVLSRQEEERKRKKEEEERLRQLRTQALMQGLPVETLVGPGQLNATSTVESLRPSTAREILEQFGTLARERRKREEKERKLQEEERDLRMKIARAKLQKTLGIESSKTTPSTIPKIDPVLERRLYDAAMEAGINPQRFKGPEGLNISSLIDEILNSQNITQMNRLTSDLQAMLLSPEFEDIRILDKTIQGGYRGVISSLKEDIADSAYAESGKIRSEHYDDVEKMNEKLDELSEQVVNYYRQWFFTKIWPQLVGMSEEEKLKINDIIFDLLKQILGEE